MSVDDLEPQTPEQRRTLVIALYQDGYSQAEIARRVGVVPERVRQILADEGIPKRSRAEQREADYQLAVRGRAGEIEATFWQVRDFEETGLRLGLDKRHVRKLLEDLWPDISIFEAVDWGAHQQFTDDALLEALRTAAGSSGMASPMTNDDYDQWASAAGSSESRPAGITILMRFAGWRPALVRAGLPANVSRRGPGTFTVEVCAHALADAWRELGKPPSMAEYDAWHREHPGGPGGDMIRARFRRWTEAKIAAYPLVHGKTPPLAADGSRPSAALLAPAAASVGRAYRSRTIAGWHAAEDVFPVDPSVMERSVRSHFELEESLANSVRAAGLVPLSPTGSDPQFDLAWRLDDRLHVVEVKSATPMNVESQMRLGFGQLLRYAEELLQRGERVQPVLAIELTPKPIWSAVASRAGVRLVHPGSPLALGSVRSA